MQNKVGITQYISKLQNELNTGRAREHSYRPALKDLIEAIVPDVLATNEPSREKVGAPDFVITRREVPIGFGETKDITEDLDAVEKSEQIKRYHALGNLFVTNNLEFRFYANGERQASVRVGRIESGKIVPDEQALDQLVSLFKEFSRKKTSTISSAKQLAIMMADRARIMRDVIYRTLTDTENEESALHEQLKAFREVLIKDMSEKDFADVYSQTIAYGLFVARYHDQTPSDFTRREAEELIPKTNPFLRNLFHHIAGPDLDERIKWIIDALAEALNQANVEEIMKQFTATSRRDDPVIHFYETFLKEYDPKVRKARGVYYTPAPIVSFIVRSIDLLLKKEFNLPRGLTDTSKVTIKKHGQGKTKREREKKVDVHKVQILDPAAGTGTFLNEIIKHIHQGFEGQQGVWQGYVNEHLLPRLHGFELMMAPYTMAHLKLSMTLEQTGYTETGKRLGVYLTNSLEEGHADYDTLFARWFADEANAASRIKKEMPIMVVTGNPPYSGVSSNMDKWITDLIEDYKYVEGVHFGEKKHWLHDDYVKFIRLAEHFIECNGEGIVALITNNGFLDNSTFRGMRWHLLKTFDQIYVFDLHGSTKRHESVMKDENVFDIQQGVAISLMAKTSKSKKLAKVFHADLYGTRKEKEEKLWNSDLENVKWKKLRYSEPYFFFVPREEKGHEEYKQGISIPDLFNVNVTGVVTARDKLVIDIDRNILRDRIEFFCDVKHDDNYVRRTLFSHKKDGKYLSGDSRGWKLVDARKRICENDHDRFITHISYRPFDTRSIYYHSDMVDWGREKIMRHMTAGANLALCTCRQLSGNEWRHVSISNAITDDSFVSNRSRERGYVFPLYLFPDKNQGSLESTSRRSNLNAEILANISRQLGINFIQDGVEGSKESFGSEDIFDYFYAVLHSPTYRKKYNEFLKIDFPRVPLTNDKSLFWKLVELGRALRKSHLMESPALNEPITTFSIPGDDVLEKPRFEGNEIGRVWINKQQYFEGVPKLAWEFYVGGYQPAQKWLKDRKGRKLTTDDLVHYQKIIKVLVETNRLMQDINQVTTDWI